MLKRTQNTNTMSLGLEARTLPCPGLALGTDRRQIVIEGRQLHRMAYGAHLNTVDPQDEHLIATLEFAADSVVEALHHNFETADLQQHALVELTDLGEASWLVLPAITAEDISGLIVDPTEWDSGLSSVQTKRAGTDPHATGLTGMISSRFKPYASEGESTYSGTTAVSPTELSIQADNDVKAFVSKEGCASELAAVLEVAGSEFGSAAGITVELQADLDEEEREALPQVVLRVNTHEDRVAFRIARKRFHQRIRRANLGMLGDLVAVTRT